MKIYKFFFCIVLILISTNIIFSKSLTDINILSKSICDKITYNFYYENISKQIKKEPSAILNKKDIVTNIVKAGLKYNISPFLIYKIIKTESNFNQFAVSCKNAKGLMQLRDIAIKDLGIRIEKINIFDISTNIDLGVRFLKKMLNKAGDDLPLALTYYNKGIAKVAKLQKKNKIIKIVYNNYTNRILFKGEQSEMGRNSQF